MLHGTENELALISSELFFFDSNYTKLFYLHISHCQKETSRSEGPVLWPQRGGLLRVGGTKERQATNTLPNVNFHHETSVL